MKNRSGILFCFAGVAALALSVLVFAATDENPQGQYRLSYSPLVQNSDQSATSLATYSRIKSIDGNTIQLRGDDGITYIFTLTVNTIYCQGDTKVSDWSYLKSVPKKDSVTVLTADAENSVALVIWDKPPTISLQNGQLDFALPPLCK